MFPRNAPPPRTVILGGSGFVGSALAARLGERGFAVAALNSRALDLAASGADRRLAELLGRDAALILAARSPAPPDTEENYRANRTLDACAARAIRLNPPARVLDFSTIAVHGEGNRRGAIHEDSPLVPRNRYAAAKAEGERELGSVCRAAGVPFTVLRPCKVYGPGDPSRAYGPASFIASIVAGELVSVFGDGEERRDHVFITDVAETGARVIEEGLEGTYCLASGECETFAAILDRLRTIAGQPVTVRREARDRPPVDVLIDNRRLLKALPGLRFTPLEAGLARAFWWAVEARRRAEEGGQNRPRPTGGPRAGVRIGASWSPRGACALSQLSASGQEAKDDAP